MSIAYDAEGRLVLVTGSGMIAQFTYDGDGKRLKSVEGGITILFVSVLLRGLLSNANRP